MEFIRRNPEFADAGARHRYRRGRGGWDVAGNCRWARSAGGVVFAVCPQLQHTTHQYGIEEMDAAGATIRAFRVQAVLCRALCLPQRPG